MPISSPLLREAAHLTPAAFEFLSASGFLERDKLYSGLVNAVAQMRRLRSVIVLVTKMRVAAFADYVHPLGLLGRIHVGANVLLGDGSRETVKAASAVKFGLRAEHRIRAANAPVQTGIVKLKIRTVVLQIAASLARHIE